MAEATKGSQVQQYASELEKFVGTQVANLEAVFTEGAKMESKGMQQLVGSWGEAGKYAKESLALAEKMTAEWRKLALEATRRGAALITPKA